MSTSTNGEPSVRLLDIDTKTTTRWFSEVGGVVYDGDEIRVYVGDTLLGQFECSDIVARDLILSTLALDPHMHLARLADAFKLSTEMLRRIRVTRSEHGIAALVVRERRGARPSLTAKQRLAMERSFEAGASINDVFAKQGKNSVSRATIGRVYKAWKLSASVPADAPTTAPNSQLPLDAASETPASIEPTVASPTDAMRSPIEATDGPFIDGSETQPFTGCTA